MMGGHYNKEAVKDMVAYNVDSEECVLLGDAESGDTSMTYKSFIKFRFDAVVSV